MESIFKKKEIKYSPKHAKGTLYDADKAVRGNITVIRWHVEMDGWKKYTVQVNGRDVLETNDIEQVKETVEHYENL